MLFYDRVLAGKLFKIRDQVPATPATEEARNVIVLCIHIYKIIAHISNIAVLLIFQNTESRL